jgi:hypothetical protein
MDREQLRDLVAERIASGPQIDWGEDEADLLRDLEQFAALAPTLGRDAQRETPLDVVIEIDPSGLVATTIVDGGWWLDDGAGVPWMQIARKARRGRIRRAARARKARRGWR